MGRDVTGLRIDKKPNAKPNGATLNRVHVAPKISNGKAEQEENVIGDHDANEAVNERSQEKQDVLTVKSTNTKSGSPEGKPKVESLKPTDKKLTLPVKVSSETDAKGSSQPSLQSLHSAEISVENCVPSMSIADKVEIADATISPSKVNEMHTPVTTRRPQPDSLLMSGKHMQAGSKKYHEEEDTCSLASSVATSVQTLRSKVTVPMGPTFRSSERLARRKEFYTKLEEKHKALETEKLEYVARSKEEEEAAIKQLRKNMTYRANPVPNFYREGPPPKVELKKLPVTRAKSPNFTRRKSCGDAVKLSSDEKKSASRPTRHSIGVLKNGIASPTSKNKDPSSTRVHKNGIASPTTKNKDLSTTRNVKGPIKLKDSNGSSKTKARPKQEKEIAIIPQFESEQKSPAIPIVEETITSHVSEQNPDPAVVEDKMKNAEASIIEGGNMDSQQVIEA